MEKNNFIFPSDLLFTHNCFLLVTIFFLMVILLNIMIANITFMFENLISNTKRKFSQIIYKDYL